MPEDSDLHQVTDSPEQNTGEKKEAESEAGKLGLVFGLIYGTGLATANVFLAQYGTRDFSLLKPKAIFTGAIVLGTIALISAGPMNLISRYIDHPEIRKRWNKHNLGAVALRLLLPFVVLLAFTIASVLQTEGIIVNRRNFDKIVDGIRQGLLYTVGLLFDELCDRDILNSKRSQISKHSTSNQLFRYRESTFHHFIVLSWCNDRPQPIYKSLYYKFV